MNPTLASVPIGASATVVSVEAEPLLKSRLTDLGLTQGCRVRCLYTAPSGDPHAYAVRSTVLAIRNRDAARIEVLPWD